MRNRLSLLIVAGLLLTVTVPGGMKAQRVAFDSTLEKYRVEYYSADLRRTVAAIVDPPNQIDPALVLASIGEVDSELQYQYTVHNRRGMRSRQAVVEFDFDCPARELMSVRMPAEWTIGIGVGGAGSRHTCDLLEDTPDRHMAVEPGESLAGFEFQTAMLPAVGMARFWGDAERVQWPKENIEERDLAVSQAVKRISGITGGWVERTVVTPTRDPRGLGASDILQGLEEDLVKVCEEREWISEALCRSYRASLSELMMAIREERLSGAREQATDLRGDVEESWQAPERQLEPDAYWLVRTNLEAVITRLADDTPSEGGSGESLSSEATGPAPAPAADKRAARQSTGFWSRLWRAIRNLPAA